MRELNIQPSQDATKELRSHEIGTGLRQHTAPQPVQPQTSPQPVQPQTSPQPVQPQTSPQPVLPQTSPQPVLTQTSPQPVQPQTSPQPVQPQTSPQPVQPQTSPQPVLPQTSPQPVQPQTSPQPVQSNLSTQTAYIPSQHCNSRLLRLFPKSHSGSAPRRSIQCENTRQRTAQEGGSSLPQSPTFALSLPHGFTMMPEVCKVQSAPMPHPSNSTTTTPASSTMDTPKGYGCPATEPTIAPSLQQSASSEPSVTTPEGFIKPPTELSLAPPYSGAEMQLGTRTRVGISMFQPPTHLTLNLPQGRVLIPAESTTNTNMVVPPAPTQFFVPQATQQGLGANPEGPVPLIRPMLRCASSSNVFLQPRIPMYLPPSGVPVLPAGPMPPPQRQPLPAAPVCYRYPVPGAVRHVAYVPTGPRTVQLVFLPGGIGMQPRPQAPLHYITTQGQFANPRPAAQVQTHGPRPIAMVSPQLCDPFEQPPEPVTHEVSPPYESLDPLTADVLASVSPQEAKEMVGEHLFPLVEEMEPELAGKIVGMLLPLETTDLLVMLESRDVLRAKVEQAVSVLKEYRAACQETTEEISDKT